MLKFHNTYMKIQRFLNLIVRHFHLSKTNFKEFYQTRNQNRQIQNP